MDPWGGAGLVIVAFYAAILVLLGWLGFRARRSESLADFYLGGGTLGFVVLLSTLYATQYSGNTFLGYPGQAYRIGFAWVMSVGMMMAVIVVYLLFAPQLHVLSHRFGYVTPGDWVRHRFGDRRLALLVSAVMALALLNYLYAQFIAMGHVVVGISDGRLPFWAGVIGLAVIIGLYETLGGMRSVAWTDVVQGFLLFAGILVVLALVWPQAGSLDAITRRLLAEQPELVRVPTWSECGNWISSIALLGCGAAVYPQAIQRIYAARDERALGRSLQVMIFMPLFTTFIVFLIGILAHGLLPVQTGLATDRVMPEILAQLMERGRLAQWGSALVLTGGLAAIMSTADSALLTLSSILARDFIGERDRTLTEASLARAGKWLSWAIIAFLVVMALRPITTLWRLIEIKMEVLMQAAPIFILGIRSPHLDARTALRALAVGCGLSLAALFAGVSDVGGIHAGTLACAVNAAICGLGIARAKTARAAR
jgi:SSS family solute:Na+ symporter/sodium/pantothenate symporter